LGRHNVWKRTHPEESINTYTQGWAQGNFVEAEAEVEAEARQGRGRELEAEARQTKFAARPRRGEATPEKPSFP